MKREELLDELADELMGDACAATHDRTPITTNRAIAEHAAERVLARIEKLVGLKVPE